MQRLMQSIDRVVMLMLENRSLDNVLGWLYEGGNQPRNYSPATNRARYDGLVAGKFSNPLKREGRVTEYLVTRATSAKDENFYLPPIDPNEEYASVITQLFGTEQTVEKEPPPGTPAGMRGFLQDYYDKILVPKFGFAANEILECFGPEQLPTLNGIARQFAVSDAWFSSVPTQTNPNRAFSLCGTSLGRQSNLHMTAVETFDARTIFNVLGDNDVSWGLYYQDVWKEEKCFTHYTFPKIDHAGKGEIGKLDQFFKRLFDGTLPKFTYLEPKWSYGLTWIDVKAGIFGQQGNDYHPPASTDPAEEFLYLLMDSLTSQPWFDNTLFILTFDEHGGTYDHVGPPWNATPPDGHVGEESGFRFNRFGVRVPTVLISPRVASSTVFRSPTGVPFDHTSVLKTLMLWQGIDPATSGLGARMMAAPTFESVVSDQIVNFRGGVNRERDDFMRSILPLRRRQNASVPNAMNLVPMSFADISPAPNPMLEGIGVGDARLLIRVSKDRQELAQNIARYRHDPRHWMDLISDE